MITFRFMIHMLKPHFGADVSSHYSIVYKVSLQNKMIMLRKIDFIFMAAITASNDNGFSI